MTSAPPSGMTVKRERFIREYLIDGNATQAAIRAGYSPTTAQQIGYQVLHTPEIAERITAQQQLQQERILITADAVLQELGRIAMLDSSQAFDAQGRCLPLQDLPLSLRRAIAGFETTDDDQPARPGHPARSTVRRLRWCDKVRALELLGKHFRLFASMHEVTLSSEGAHGLKRLLGRVHGGRGPGNAREATGAGSGPELSVGDAAAAAADDGTQVTPE